MKYIYRLTALTLLVFLLALKLLVPFYIISAVAKVYTDQQAPSDTTGDEEKIAKQKAELTDCSFPEYIVAFRAVVCPELFSHPVSFLIATYCTVPTPPPWSRC